MNSYYSFDTKFVLYLIMAVFISFVYCISEEFIEYSDTFNGWTVIGALVFIFSMK